SRIFLQDWQQIVVLENMENEAVARSPLECWSGLSESNRHLNLGKVPYYHYTKAAQRPSFYSMTAPQRQAFLARPGRKPNTHGKKKIRKPGLSGQTSPPASGAGAPRSAWLYPCPCK